MKTIEHIHTLSEFPMPSSEAIEAQLIADVCACPTMLPEIQGIVNPDMFSIPVARAHFVAIVDKWGKGENISIDTIAYSVDFVWFRDHVLPCSTTIIGMVGHAEDLKAAAQRRLAYFTAIKLLNKCQDPMTTADNLCEISDKLTKAIMDEAGMRKVQRIDEVANDLLLQLQEQTAVRVPTGIPYLDQATYGGFHGSWLVVLAARPGVGKTALALHMAKAAKNAGKHCLYFSLEMENTELVQRLILSTRKVTAYELATRSINWQHLESAVGEVATGSMYLDDKDHTLTAIQSVCRIMKAQGKLDEVIIDFLGLIGVNKGTSKLEQISFITAELKILAKELRVPVIILSQLNRELAKEKRHPRLSDLRESGSVEQDADMVLMLEDVDAQGSPTIDKEDNDCPVGREHNSKGDVIDHRVNCFIAKHRHGRAKAKIRLLADATYNNFRDIDDGR